MQSIMRTATAKLGWKGYVALPDDGLRREILDGEVVVTPSAGSPHQGIHAQLMIEFGLRVLRSSRGQVFSDLDCQLGPHDIVRPDVLVVLPEHAHRILAAKVDGTPDLAIEVLSPGTARRDRTKKLRRYEAAGTPELWLVDGATRTVTQFVHDGTRFRTGVVRRRTVRPSILPGVVIPLRAIW
jgi:Uma2 family endonuclease